VIELLICDDSKEARAALHTMLCDHDEVELVGEAENGEEGVSLALSLRPDVVLMDLHMPVVDGVEATRRIAKLLPSIRVVAYSGADDSGSVDAMMEAGAAAYLVKGAPLWELERAIAGRAEPLVRLAHGLAKATSRASVGTVVCRELMSLTGASATAAYLAAPDVALSLAACSGAARGSGLTAPPRLVSQAFRARRRVRAREDDLRELAALGLRCSGALAEPLVEGGAALGALLVAMPVNSELVADAELVAEVAGLAGGAFAAERRLALTYAEARRDAVTGLANRRALDERLDEALGAAEAAGGEVTLVLLEVDDVHAGGDAILAGVARVAARVLRAGEELFRVGGGEFAVVVDGDEAAGVTVAERMGHALELQSRGGSLPPLSAGVASFPRDARTPIELLGAADAALAVSRRRGSSRVTSFRRRGGQGAGAREPADATPSVGSRGRFPASYRRGVNRAPDVNVVGGALQPCSHAPLTGFFRDGCCATGPEDVGSHTVCAVMTEAFLEFSRATGNDLSTPRPEWGFGGLVPGDRWCVCASRWLEAHEAGVAPPVVLGATHERALELVPIEALTALAAVAD
jgi:uncharacterized protein